MTPNSGPTLPRPDKVALSELGWSRGWGWVENKERTRAGGVGEGGWTSGS